MSTTDIRVHSGIGIDLNTHALLFLSLTSDSIFKVGVGINYWDDPKGLIQILTDDIVYDYVDYFFIINGRYKGRRDAPVNHPNYLSDLMGIYDKLIVTNMDDYTQIEKRNMYWKHAGTSSMDYMIVCDSDEYIKIKPDTLNCLLQTIQDRPEQCYPVEQVMEGGMTMTRPRLFKAPFDFGHVESDKDNTISHGSLYNGDGVEIINQQYEWFKDHPKCQINSENQAGVPGIELYHDKTYRTRERVIADRVYYDENPNR